MLSLKELIRTFKNLSSVQSSVMDRNIKIIAKGFM